MNVHQATTGLPNLSHQNAIQQPNRISGDPQQQLDGLLFPGLESSVAFPSMDLVDTPTGASAYPSLQTAAAGEQTTAPATTTSLRTNTNNYPRGDQVLEPGSSLSRLNSTSLDMNNLFDQGDFLLADLDFPTQSPLVLQNETQQLQAHAKSAAEEENTSRPAYIHQQQGNADAQDGVGRGANVFSRIGSPLPALPHSTNRESRGTLEATASGPCWKVSQADYVDLQADVAKHSDVLPSPFTLPSRQTMSYYLERCINSLYKHQPLLHVPSFKVGTTSLELILAMCATGAQLRFESHLGTIFFHASKALILSRLQDRHESSIVGSLKHNFFRSEMVTPQALKSPNSAIAPHAFDGVSPSKSDLSNGSQSRARAALSSRQLRLQTMQAILTLMSFGSWGPKGLLGESIILQSVLVMLTREEGLGPEADFTLDENQSTVNQWHAWIEVESWRRIKVLTYYFTNLQSLAYNMPPPVMTAEVQCHTPASADEWAAASAHRWEEVRGAAGVIAVPFQVAFRSLFQRDNGAAGQADYNPSISAVGNYALIYGILQCIYFLRQHHPVPFPDTDDNGSSLRREDIDGIIRALHRWQSWWEKCPESTIEPEASAGPISFNAIACLRLAWIRLYADLGPCRNLATRDSGLIVEIFTSGPPQQRHPRLTPVLLQAIHALSVPVRLGIKFVARTQTLFWSVNQSLCTLECAVLLNKWFETLASTIAQTPLSKQEKNLLLMIRGIVLESGFFTEEDLSALSLAGAPHPPNGTNSSPSNPGFDGNSVGGDGDASNLFVHFNGTGISSNGLHDDNGSTSPGQQRAHSIGDEDFGDGLYDARILGIDADSGHWAILQEMVMPTPPSPTDDDSATASWQRQISCLRIAVARLWAEVFSDNHVFDLVTTIGRTLNIHAGMLQCDTQVG